MRPATLLHASTDRVAGAGLRALDRGVAGAFGFVARVCGVAIAILGATALLGWILDDPVLKGERYSRGITIKANTALALFAAGLSLVLAAFRGARAAQVARALAAGVATIGGLTLFQHVTGWSLGIDQLLFAERPGEVATTSPNRMGPPASTCLLLAGIALLVARGDPRRPPLAQGLGASVCVIALLPILGYLYGIEELYGIARYTGIALPTAVGLLALGLGTVCSVPHGPVSALFSAPSAGGVLLRRMTGPVLLLPILLGYLFVLGQRTRFFDPAYGAALLVIVLVVGSCGLVWSSARALERLAAESARARQERRGIEERLNLAVIDANMGMWDADAQTGTAIWTASHFRSLGYEPRPGGEATDGLWLSRVHPDDRPRVLAEIEQAREQRTLYRSRYRIVRADTGAVRWLDAFGRFLFDEHGRARRFVGIFFDATEQQANLERLRASEALLRTATENANVGLAVLDRERRHTYANPAYTQLLGLGGAELVGTPMAEALGTLHGEAGPRLERAFGGERVGFELSVSRPGKARARLTITYEPQLGPQGDVSEVVAVVVDVSERHRAMRIERHLKRERERLLESERAARREAEHASRLKDEFLATVSHELRTPLNAILGWSQLLALDPLPPHVEKGIETITRNARVQAQLIEDLLDMSRIMAGKIRLEACSMTLAPVVKAAVESIEPLARDKGVRVTSTTAGENGYRVHGDAARLQQVLWNLLSNAVKFTPSGGKVEVSLQRVDGHVEVVVRDSGKGIRPEFLPHVFERFRQADSTTTREHGGLGIGLAIVKQIVDLHGGTVYADSAGDGRGTTFVVRLPVAPPAAPRPAVDPHDTAFEPKLPLDHPDVTGVRVLAVDDEPDAREMVQRVLEGSNAVVETAGTADAALRRLEEQEFDVLVADIGMPGKDGYQLIRELRAREKESGRTLPAVALTAFARVEDRRRALRAGFHSHLAKPVEPVELLAAVATLAGRLEK